MLLSRPALQGRKKCTWHNSSSKYFHFSPPLSSDVLWPLCQIWQQPHPEPRESQEAVLPVASPRAVRSCGPTGHPHPAWRHARKLHRPQALGLWLLASITEQDHRQVKMCFSLLLHWSHLCNMYHLYIVYTHILDAFTRLRWCGLPISGSSPVMKLTSSGNVMLVTFSFNRQRDGAIFKAYFQAIPKAGLSVLTNRQKHTHIYICSCLCWND